MLSPTHVWRSFSTMVGGGVRGKGAGIARGTIIPVGPTIKGFHPFIEGYRQAGGMTTGIIVGEDSPWNYQRIPNQQVNRNWSTWKKSNHWEKQQTWGVQGLKPRTQQNSRLKRSSRNPRKNRNPGRRPGRSAPSRHPGRCSRSNPDRHPGRCSRGNPDRHPGRCSHSAHSRSNGRRRNNPSLDRENLIRGEEENRTESRRREDEENHSVDDGIRDDACIAWRMLLGG